MKKNNLLGMNVSEGTYAAFIDKFIELGNTGESHYACVANVHMLVEARINPAFADIVNNASVITPDGKPLTWALKVLKRIKQERVAGMDILPDLLQRASDEHMPVFFYGGASELLQTTRSYIEQHYPALQIAGMHSPPFRQLTEAEDARTVEDINNSGAHLVFVVLGCPKQEKWMASMKGRVRATMIGVGGAMPVLIGAQKRAPGWMQKAGLEWLYRLGQEPRRLFRRYAVTNSFFIYLLSRAYLQQQLFGRR